MTDAAPLLVVAAAMIDDTGRVLVQQRPRGRDMAGMWEFPGGKIEPGEAPDAALARELAEELGVTVCAADLAPITFAVEPRVGSGVLILLLFGCRRWDGEPRALHAERIAWVTPAALAGWELPPADRGFPEAIARWVGEKS